MKRQALLYGRVIHGDGQGRKIGYPTANLADRYFKTNPQSRGVFASRAWLNGKRYDGVSVVGVPDRKKQAKIETHLLDVVFDFYGQDLTVELLGRIRPLVWYASPSALLRRIRLDVRQARSLIRLADHRDEQKIAAVRTALPELIAGMKHMPEILRVGRTELEVRDRLRRVFKKRQPSFPFIVAAGPSGAFMHHAPTRRKLRAGDSVVVDLGIKVNDYCTDLTRTYFMGRPSALLKQRYLKVLKAQERGLTKVAPFSWGKEIDRIVRGSLRDGQLHKAFIHSTGHGVGLKIHQPPSLGPRSVDMLLPGQIVTVEPGIYFKGWGGIRIEDMVLVGNHGASSLTTKIPRSLREMTIVLE